MPVESATYIGSLNASNPVASDGMGQGDDHIRLIKSTILNSFTAITGATDVTHGTLNDLEDGIFEFADGTASAPALRSVTTPALGLYRVSASTLGISQGKRLSGNGAAAVGSLHKFPKVPGSSIFSNGGTATANPERIEYLECDGGVYNFADFPDLAAFLLGTFGGNGVTTFAVPDYYTAGKFLRSRTASVAVGTSQTSANLAHTHTATTSSDGGFTPAGTVSNPTIRSRLRNRNDAMGVGSVNFLTDAASSTNGTSDNDAVFSVSAPTFTGTPVAAHTHTLTTASDGGSEARPTNVSVVICIKT